MIRGKFIQGFKYNKLCKHLKKAISKHTGLFTKYVQQIEVPLPVLPSANKHVTSRR